MFSHVLCKLFSQYVGMFPGFDVSCYERDLEYVKQSLYNHRLTYA